MEECNPENHEDLNRSDHSSNFKQIFEKKLVEHDQQHQGSLRKPWTQERILEVINEIKRANDSDKRRVPMDYYWRGKYEIMTNENVDSLIFKKQSPTDPTVYIVPRENYFDLLSEIHESNGHGGRDKLKNDIKNRYYIRRKAVEMFVALCPKCTLKRNVPKKGTVTHYFNVRGQVDVMNFPSCSDGVYKSLLNYQDASSCLVSQQGTHTAIETITMNSNNADQSFITNLGTSKEDIGTYRKRFQLQNHLGMVLHAKNCQEQCPIELCNVLKGILKHLTICTLVTGCKEKYCLLTKQALDHYDHCAEVNCKICRGVRNSNGGTQPAYQEFLDMSSHSIDGELADPLETEISMINHEGSSITDGITSSEEIVCELEIQSIKEESITTSVPNEYYSKVTESHHTSTFSGNNETAQPQDTNKRSFNDMSTKPDETNTTVKHMKRKKTSAHTVATDLAVAIVTESLTDLSKEQIKQVKTFLDKQIIKVIKDNSHETPAFRDYIPLCGLLMLWCEDVNSLNWLQKTVASMTPLWPETKLIVRLQSYLMIKAKITFPEFEGDLQDICALLSGQNRWAEVDCWLFKNYEESEGTLDVDVPLSLWKSLQDRELRLAFSIGSVYICFCGIEYLGTDKVKEEPE